MTRYFYTAVTLGIFSVAVPLRAAVRQHSESDAQHTVVWTNDSLERLHDLDLISIVGARNEEMPESASLRQPYIKTHDPAWYAAEAAKLGDQLEHREAELRRYQQALEDAQSLRNTTGGINLDEGNIGITPEAGIEILRQRAQETQTELDALYDLARRNGIPPGALRGQ
jgi:hypothetical protein